MGGWSSGWSKRPAQPASRVLPRPRRSCCAALSPSRRPQVHGRACCSIWAWPRRVPVWRTGRSTCSRPSTPHPTPRPPGSMLSCWGWRSAGHNDPSTAASVAGRRETLLRGAADPAAPPELLAAAGMISVLGNEPAEVGAELAGRALRAGGTEPPQSGVPPWFAFATWFSQATLSLLWTERYDQLRPLLDVSIANARSRGDGGRLAVGL